MLNSFSEFKFFHSFRMPVEGVADLRFLVENTEVDGEQYISDAKLIDVSSCGLGFSTRRKLSTGQELRLSLHFKKINLEHRLCHTTSIWAQTVIFEFRISIEHPHIENIMTVESELMFRKRK